MACLMSWLAYYFDNFAFSVEKSTPAGKKYASGAGGAGDKSQLCTNTQIHKDKLSEIPNICYIFEQLVVQVCQK